MKGKTKMVCIRMAPETYQSLQSWAEENDKTTSDWIRWLLALFEDLWKVEAYRKKIVEHYWRYFGRRK